MNQQKPQQDHFTTSPSYSTNQQTQRMIQSFFLIWIDANIDELTVDFGNSLAQLRNVINDITTFKQEDDAIDFLTDIQEMNGYLIINDTIGQQIITLIHDVTVLNAIYVLTTHPYQHHQWTEKWTKIKGMYTDIPSICQALQLDVKQCDQDSIAVSFVTIPNDVPNGNLNRLEPSFMYTQLFKDILLEMEDDENSVKVLVDHCRPFYHGNKREVKIIDEFKQTYRSELAIWWYTRECFTYRMLNQALRALEGDTIINMGFFIRDLHRQIQQLHTEQAKIRKQREFILYRGQGLSTTDFEQLMKTKGGLMSFDNFLSTSEDRQVSLRFAKKARSKANTVGILFVISVKPSTSSTPFASISEHSYHKIEKETLFAMHAVFRVHQIMKLDIDDSLYRVNLTLTADDDEQLRILTTRMREENTGVTGWDRLIHLLIELNQLEKAEGLCHVSHKNISSLDEEALRYHQLGRIRMKRGEHVKALSFYEKQFDICQKTLPANHPHLATSYGNMAGVYHDMGEYSKALSFQEKALEIKQKTLPANHPHLATCYGNMAGVYRHMGEYSKALSFYEKDLEILRKTFPANHPHLATCYGNMAGVYKDMGEYSKALSFHEKDLEILRKTLPANHPSLATCYGNMAGVYQDMGEYSKALSFHEKALEICQKTLPANHPSLGFSYNNIATLYNDMGLYGKSASYFERARSIFQISLPVNHPHIKLVEKNIEILIRKL